MFRSIVDFYLFYHIKYCVKLYFIMRKLLFESKGLFYGKILILVFVIFNCETMSIGYDLINRVTCCYLQLATLIRFGLIRLIVRGRKRSFC